MANAEELGGFKEDLMSYYKENVSTIPISPTQDDSGVPIDQLYVQPWLLVKNATWIRQKEDSSNNTKIRTYKEILFGNQDSTYKKIYVSADAGMGKTSFARKMTLTWCKGLKSINNPDCIFGKEDLETIKHFDLLFYLQLEHFTEHCDLAQMITQFVDGHLSRSSKNTKEFIERLLNTKQCLIILDGLDKWIHPEKCHRKEQERSPHNRHTKCTVLTTTRPISMRLSTNQIDRHLEICDLTRRSSLKLEINAIRWLKDHSKPNSEDKDVDDFDEMMKPAQLEDVRCKPFILLQLVCIWKDGLKIGNSRFEAYCNIIALSINRSSYHQTDYASQSAVDYFVPNYLQDSHSLLKHFPVFLKLGERCLIKLRNPAFIFYEENVLEFLAQQELNFFYETGILSKTKDNSVISTLRFTVSFQDKSIEEFFTALFMASCWKNRAKRKTILQACKAHTDLFQTAFHNVMNLVKDINRESYEEMYEKIVSGNFRAALSEEIRMFGHSLIQISDEEKEDIIDDCIENTETPKNKIGKGSFGTVFKCEALKKRYSISVAVKKSHPRQTDNIPNDVIKEMNVSKTPHPFILPLLAVLREIYEKKDTFYLISPHCEKGDLYTVLHERRVFLDPYQRTRIVLQVAIAIQYLHTDVKGVKEGILHKDICSCNIVLDEKFNARLIDFGLARDMADETQTVSTREYYKHPDAKPQNKPTESWDYFSFGVVIRELITGLHPSGNKKGLLKDLRANDIDEHLDKQKLWKLSRLAEKLNKIAEKCLRPPPTFTFQNDVIKEIMEEMTERGEKVLVSKENGLCIQCMINPASSEAELHYANCRESSSVCVACEKRSFLCPVKCYTCGGELKPVIGKDWGALLIAGNDTDMEYAEAFKSDLENMKKVMTSKVPLIMGIREEHVFTVAPAKPGTIDNTDKLALKVKESFEEIRKADIDTLIVYISCHGKTEQNHAFELQSDNDILSTEELATLLQSVTTKVKTFILFMDRCYPTEIMFKSKDKYIKCIQINSCKSDTTSYVVNKASLFTKYLIEGLKPRSQKDNSNSDSSTRKEYITANTLHEYTSEQFKIGQYQHRQQKPVFYSSGGFAYDDLKIAYYTSENVTIDFDHENETKGLDVDLCQTMEDLGDALKQLFNKDVKKYDVKIKMETHRHKDQIEDCETVEKVMTAWVLRQPLKVYFKEKRDSQKRKIDDIISE